MPQTSMHAGAGPKIFELANKLRRNLTKHEQRLWEFLKNKPRGFKFRQQHPFGAYVLDFYSHKAKLSIELDGENHNEKTQSELDQHRTQFINEQGVFEMRFSNEEVDKEFENICYSIENYLKDIKALSP